MTPNTDIPENNSIQNALRRIVLEAGGSVSQHEINLYNESVEELAQYLKEVEGGFQITVTLASMRETLLGLSKKLIADLNQIIVRAGMEQGGNELTWLRHKNEDLLCLYLDICGQIEAIDQRLQSQIPEITTVIKSVNTFTKRLCGVFPFDTHENDGQ